MLLADGLTDATLFLALVTLFVAVATWRLGSRASAETRAHWRPVILVRARRDAQDQKLWIGQGRLEVDVENAGRGPALDVFTEGLKGLRRENARVSALAPGESWTCSFWVTEQPDPHAFRVMYSDISGARVFDNRAPRLAGREHRTCHAGREGASIAERGLAGVDPSRSAPEMVVQEARGASRLPRPARAEVGRGRGATLAAPTSAARAREPAPAAGPPYFSGQLSGI